MMACGNKQVSPLTYAGNSQAGLQTRTVVRVRRAYLTRVWSYLCATTIKRDAKCLCKCAGLVSRHCKDIYSFFIELIIKG